MHLILLIVLINFPLTNDSYNIKNIIFIYLIHLNATLHKNVCIENCQ